MRAPVKKPKQQVFATLGGGSLVRFAFSPNFYICWTTPKTHAPVRQSTRTTDEAVATAKLAEWHLKYSEPEKQTAATAQIGPIMQRYLTEHASKIASASANGYGCTRITEHLGHLNVKDLGNKRAVKNYIALQRESGVRDGTINRDLVMLRAALNRAHDDGTLSERPPKIAGIKPEEMREQPEEAEVFSMDKLQELFRRASKHEHLFRMIFIMAVTVSRPCAAKELAPRQVDLEHGIIHLNPPGRQQTKKRRPVVRIPNIAIPYFERWMKDADEMKPFVQYDGNAVKSVKTLWRRIVRKDMGLKGRYIPYSVRHTMATLLNVAGVDVAQISMQLGHVRADVGRMTGTYIREKFAHVRPEYLKEVSEAIDTILTEALTPADRGNVVDIKKRSVA